MKMLKALFALVCLASSLYAQTKPLTPGELATALASNPQGAEAEALAARIRQTWGGNLADLAKPPAPKVDELTVAWALEVANVIPPPANPGGGPGGGFGGGPRVVALNDLFSLPLKRVGSTNIYAGVRNFGWGDAVRWQYEVNGQRLQVGNGQLETYTMPPESKEQPGVPKGKVVEMGKWTSKIFHGATRDWWIYVPAQYTADKPACVMVFQDGQNPKNYMPVILDNMIAKGEIPVMIAIFLPPGVNPDGRSNRSFEYDTLSDQYARFLLEEILPEVEKSYKLRKDANSRAITGISSGGICAFTVAWERPDEFSKVLSWVGSFTNIQAGSTFRAGGHNYQAMIRKMPKRNIRIFMQDGAQDLDNNNGSWPLANQTLAGSLSFMGYDYRFDYGRGFHSDKHGRAILPDSLRWLWRDWRP